MANAEHKPVLLLILDGWGITTNPEISAIAQGRTPTWDKLLSEYPHTRLITHGPHVGLIEGQMGNSEVGHLNLGAGRIVYQDILAIKRMLEAGEVAASAPLNDFFRDCSRGSSVLHFIGLLSDGGVHSHIMHLRDLIPHARRRGIQRIYLHALTDGRDTAPEIAERFFAQVSDKMPSGVGFATLGGRWFGMDRDRRWDRTQQHWEAIAHGQGPRYDSWERALAAARERGEKDEFIQPSVLGDYAGVNDGDYVLFFNFRADRMRQLVSAFLFQDFDGFDRGRLPATRVFTMRRYRQDFDNEVLLKDDPVDDTITEYLCRNGYTVYKSAETEKYAHVTYFFNGGLEDPWPGEKRVLIQSPQVATYDLKPDMSVYEVTDRLVQELKGRTHDLFMVNFANGDMVGHTGDFAAAIGAVEAVDRCLEQILGAVHWGEDVNVVITADHGNCEEMKYPDGSTNTQHSMNDVPLVVVSEPRRELKPPADWSLCDVAPTVLNLMALPQPASWTGTSLLKA